MFSSKAQSLLFIQNNETVRIEAWGTDSLRVRATRNREIAPLDWALLDPPLLTPSIIIGDQQATIQNGDLLATITDQGRISFHDARSSKLLLEEVEPFLPDNPHLGARKFRTVGGDLYRIEASFQAHPGERIFGLGQHQNGLLDQKGCVIDLIQVNTRIAIPFLLSSRNYGFLWNNPAIGRVELGADTTRWVAEASRQLDYWITLGDAPADILEHYADATGHPPALPPWAAGFWQCKLRYSSQDELLSVAREHKRRGLPLSVIVIDGLHWPLMGDWCFYAKDWPDPTAMVQELEQMGIKVMVSIWPMVNTSSESFQEMNRRGLLVQTERGVPAHTLMFDGQPPGRTYLHLYDPVNPEARQYVWEKVQKGYYRHGVKVFWLDACEPEFYPLDPDNLRYHAGSGMELGCIYPFFHQQTFFDGLRAAGETEILTLSRSAWAGSQRFGAAVWSGDVASSFAALRAQVTAGLNIGLSGIPWWTTDIGGFHGGDPQSPAFRELLIRWFQFGTFSPLFRLHGFRLPVEDWTGGPNEAWSFGDEAYQVITALLHLRQRLLPYILELADQAHEKGAPPMRPLFFDFPNDPGAYAINDQFMFGPNLLVAPVLDNGARSRMVYLPAGCDWQDAWTEATLPGGQWIEAAAPIERIPLYLRANLQLPIAQMNLS
jgi:alpha-D-xyloside xylohydrolase